MRRREAERCPGVLANLGAKGLLARLARSAGTGDRPPMSLQRWRELDVTNWPEVGYENRGLRPKAWLGAPDGSTWLRKEPRDSRPFELAIEATAARLARACGLEAPSTHV